MESVVLNEARVVANYVRVRYSAQDLHLLEGGRLVLGLHVLHRDFLEDVDAQVTKGLNFEDDAIGATTKL